MSKEKSPQIVTLDGASYDANDFNEQQMQYLNHVIDLDRKLNSTMFQIQQLQVGKDSFMRMLKEALADVAQIVDPKD